MQVRDVDKHLEYGCMLYKTDDIDFPESEQSDSRQASDPTPMSLQTRLYPSAVYVLLSVRCGITRQSESCTCGF
jgi:hypothetical protein